MKNRVMTCVLLLLSFSATAEPVNTKEVRALIADMQQQNASQANKHDLGRIHTLDTETEVFTDDMWIAPENLMEYEATWAPYIAMDLNRSLIWRAFVGFIAVDMTVDNDKVFFEHKSGRSNKEYVVELIDKNSGSVALTSKGETEIIPVLRSTRLSQQQFKEIAGNSVWTEGPQASCEVRNFKFDFESNARRFEMKDASFFRKFTYDDAIYHEYIKTDEFEIEIRSSFFYIHTLDQFIQYIHEYKQNGEIYTYNHKWLSRCS